MNYYEAAKIRKKGFADLMTDKLTSGQGVFSSARSALSDRSKARSLGFKEKFNLLNIAKVLTGGSNLAPAILGRLLGRKTSDIRYFTGKKEYTPRSESSYYNNYTTPSMSGGSQKATRVLQKMLSFMEKSRTDDMQEQDTLDSFNEMNEKMREDRHKEVMDVFIEATNAKVRRRFDKHMAKEAKKREKGSKKKEPEVKKETKLDKTESKKQTTPETAEAPKTKTKTETTPTEKAKPVQTAPTTVPAQSVPAQSTVTPKLSTVSSAVTETAKTAVKTVTGTATKTAVKVGVGVAVGAAATMSIKRIIEVGPGYNIVELQSGETVRQEGAWNWRNNNPGNIEYGDYALSKGAIPFSHGKNKPQTDAERFAIFPTYEAGRNAKAGLIFEGKNYKNLTLDDAIARYAPPTNKSGKFENDTAGYQKEVKTALNLPEEKLKTMKMQDFNQEQRILILNAMQKIEGYGSGTKKTKILSFGSNVPETGSKLNDVSNTNAGMKKDMSQGSFAGGPVIIQNNNTTQAKTNIQRTAPQEQLNPTMR